MSPEELTYSEGCYSYNGNDLSHSYECSAIPVEENTTPSNDCSFAPAEESLIMMQVEDGIVTLERANRDTLFHPLADFPESIPYREGTIVRAIVSNDTIHFIGIDTLAMEQAKAKRRQRLGKRQRLKARARRSTAQMQTVSPEQTEP